MLDGIINSAKLKNIHEVMREAAVQAALGLTTTEAENAFSLSVVETNGTDHRIISRERANTLKRNGLVEVVGSTTSLEDIGGLGLLKEWLQRRSGAFSESAKAYGLPLLRLDMGRVFGGIVGQSEANLRSVIGSTDGGTSSRVFGSFLSWMQEKEKPMFVVATANDEGEEPGPKEILEAMSSRP